jgi:hypothetical protein
MLSFNEYLTEYVLNEYMIYPEYDGVLKFIGWLKSKKLDDVNESNFPSLVQEFNGGEGNSLSVDFLHNFWDSFCQDLRSNGIKDNFNYNFKYPVAKKS